MPTNWGIIKNATISVGPKDLYGPSPKSSQYATPISPTAIIVEIIIVNTDVIRSAFSILFLLDIFDFFGNDSVVVL